MLSIQSVGLELTSSVASSASPARAANLSPHTADRAPVALSALQDLVEISSVPSSSQVPPLQTGNLSQFQGVLADAVRQLRAAVLHATDPAEVAFLTSLADRFQRLQETGGSDLAASAASGK